METSSCNYKYTEYHFSFRCCFSGIFSVNENRNVLPFLNVNVIIMFYVITKMNLNKDLNVI